MRPRPRTARLVADLLTLSRADSGDLPVGATRAELADIARQSADAHQERARAGGVSVVVDAPAAVWVRGDADALRRLVDNLLDNAVRYAPKGTAVAVSVSGRGGQASLSVTDHGPGILASAQPRIFDRFYRADASRARRSGGTGLGLAIAQAIAAAHGGTLGVRSQAGAGAEFQLRLPAVPAPAPVALAGGVLAEE